MKNSLSVSESRNNVGYPHKEAPTITRWRIVWRRRGWSLSTNDHYALKSSEAVARAFARRLRLRRTAKGGSICWVRIEQQTLMVLRPWGPIR